MCNLSLLQSLHGFCMLSMPCPMIVMLWPRIFASEIIVYVLLQPGECWARQEYKLLTEKAVIIYLFITISL